jgi:DNA-directed RNA polymerase specialized sigma subunit
MEDIIVKMMDLESEINVDIDRLVDTKRAIKQAVECVPDISQRTLLELRYICGKTWEEIAEEMFFGIRWVHRLHEKALRSVRVKEK